MQAPEAGRHDVDEDVLLVVEREVAQAERQDGGQQEQCVEAAKVEFNAGNQDGTAWEEAKISELASTGSLSYV